jgi:putative thiamine transport system permease protein
VPAARRAGLLRLAPALTVAAFLLPIAAGLIGTMLPMLGYLPAIGGTTVSLAPWRELLGEPGIASAVRLSVATGFLATVLSLVVAAGFAALLPTRAAFRRAEPFLAPVLAAPHSAIAIGLAFLLVPSGWLVRLVSPWLTGWTSPPDVVIVGDSWGLALVLGLMVKEVPYLLLMLLAALNQVPAEAHLRIARSLGYGRGVAWVKIVLPQVYPQIRLPVYAVLAFSLSVVDVALILGPSNPPPLSVMALRWFADPDVSLYFPAAAAASLQFAIVLVAIGLWRLGEVGAVRLGRGWIARGGRGLSAEPGLRAAGVATSLLAALSAIGMLGMALWSVASTWRFPDVLPSGWTLATWARHLSRLWWPGWATCLIGLVAAGIAVVLTLACLENEARLGRRAGARALWLLYIPLLVPQIAFFFGAQVLLIRLKLDGTLFAVVWSHLLFVLPYVFLSLADPWRALDPRYVRTAVCLGASPNRVLLHIKLPMLLRPILIAAAIGFAVSVGQYLPTLFAGNGRVATLTTEAVTLAAGADRRVIGVYAFLQLFLPFVGYALALAVPQAIQRRGFGSAGSR